MTEPSHQQPNPALKTDDLRPFVNYRNPQDDKIALAIQEAERRLREAGKPLVKD